MIGKSDPLLEEEDKDEDEEIMEESLSLFWMTVLGLDRDLLPFLLLLFILFCGAHCLINQIVSSLPHGVEITILEIFLILTMISLF